MASSPTTVMRLDLALRALDKTGGDPSPARFIDIGTGEGEFLVMLAKRGYEGLSVDVSEEALARASKLLARRGVTSVALEHGDLFELEGQWPLVTCFEVLEHLEDDEAAVSRLAGLVRPGGRLLASVPARPELWGGSDVVTGHVRRYEREELRAKLEAAGLEVELLWSVGVPLANVLLAVRRRALAKRARSQETLGADRETRTRRSSYARSFGVAEWLWPVLFNRLTLWPALVVQRLLAGSPRGTGIIVVARRP